MRPRLAWALLGAAVALELAWLGMAIAAHVSGRSAGAAVGLMLVFTAFAAVGAVVASHRPENPIGWLLCASAICMILANVASAYIDLAARFELRGALAVAVAANWTWPCGIGLLVPLVLVFPDGRPLPRVRRFVWPIVVAWMAVLVAGVVVAPGAIVPAKGARPAIDNPAALGGVSTVLVVLTEVGGFVLVALSAISLILRWRRAADERRQISWLLMSVAVVIAGIVVNGTNLANLPDAFWIPAWATIPVAIGIAVLRYRLYEIDMIVRRTLIYGAVSALLAGVYAGIVLLLQDTLGSVTRGNELAVAGSTLAVAALFRPVLRRVQTVVDRRFYRRRYDAERTLEVFGMRLKEQIDLEVLQGHLIDAVDAAMQPTHVQLWVRETA